jgi:phosphopantothenoylcysteine decarboxylase/phosphopantothenate--cysteine ligase
MQTDLTVDQISPCLSKKTIDFIVCGSIGCIESPRLIRSLRRLGAQVRPYQTDGAAMFITKMSLEWASAMPVVDSFQGLATHLSTSDALVIAPLTADFLAKIALGICNDPASTLVQSALGQGKKVIAIPSMHDSLWNSPATKKNLELVSKSVVFIEPRIAEGKRKFPEPNETADRISHEIRRNQTEVLVTMGPTKAYIDDVRFISNYSSGALGTAMVTELYRHGATVHCVCGPSLIKPKVYSQLILVETNQEMQDAVQTVSSSTNAHLIMAAAVLDYVPKERFKGKMRSGTSEASIELVPTSKILSSVKQNGKKRVAFKLEPEGSNLEEKSKEYLNKYSLDYIFVNRISEVNSVSHSGFLYSKDGSVSLNSKSEVALKLTEILVRS